MPMTLKSSTTFLILSSLFAGGCASMQPPAKPIPRFTPHWEIQVDMVSGQRKACLGETEVMDLREVLLRYEAQLSMQQP